MNQLLEVTPLGQQREEGATAVEYAVMVALIAAVVIVAVVLLGENASSTFDCLGQELPDPTGTHCP